MHVHAHMAYLDHQIKNSPILTENPFAKFNVRQSYHVPDI